MKNLKTKRRILIIFSFLAVLICSELLLDLTSTTTVQSSNNIDPVILFLGDMKSLEFIPFLNQSLKAQGSKVSAKVILTGDFSPYNTLRLIENNVSKKRIIAVIDRSTTPHSLSKKKLQANQFFEPLTSQLVNSHIFNLVSNLFFNQKYKQSAIATDYFDRVNSQIKIENWESALKIQLLSESENSYDAMVSAYISLASYILPKSLTEETASTWLSAFIDNYKKIQILENEITKHLDEKNYDLLKSKSRSYLVQLRGLYKITFESYRIYLDIYSSLHPDRPAPTFSSLKPEPFKRFNYKYYLATQPNDILAWSESIANTITLLQERRSFIVLDRLAPLIRDLKLKKGYFSPLIDAEVFLLIYDIYTRIAPENYSKPILISAFIDSSPYAVFGRKHINKISNSNHSNLKKTLAKRSSVKLISKAIRKKSSRVQQNYHNYHCNKKKLKPTETFLRKIKIPFLLSSGYLGLNLKLAEECNSNLPSANNISLKNKYLFNDSWDHSLRINFAGNKLISDTIIKALNKHNILNR